jgi:hypothetical protein
MSVEIDTITVSSVEDRRLVLNNAQAARVIDIGSSWSTLRLGIRYCVDDTGANITGTPRFYLGLLASPSAGMANGPLGLVTSHFLGFRSGFATWTRQVGPPINYIAENGDLNRLIKKVNNTVTTTGTGIAIRAGVNAVPNRSALIIEIVKGSPNFTINFCSPIGAPSDIPNPNAMINAFQLATMANIATYLNGLFSGSYSANPTGTIAVDEGTNGSLNAICVAWDRSVPVMRISEILWAKMA